MSLDKTTVKCKCGSINLEINELCGHSISWEQRNGMIDRDYGILEPGDPYKVQAECNECGKRWTIRKAIQISDILK